MLFVKLAKFLALVEEQKIIIYDSRQDNKA
jgi:hypothetical protein